MAGERGVCRLCLVFTTRPTLEVPFASVWSIVRAGAVRFRGGGGLVACKSRKGGFGGDMKELCNLACDGEHY